MIKKINITKRILHKVLEYHTQAVNKAIWESDVRITQAYQQAERVKEKAREDVSLAKTEAEILQDLALAATKRWEKVVEAGKKAHAVAVAEAEAVNKTEGAIQDNLSAELAKIGAFAREKEEDAHV